MVSVLFTGLPFEGVSALIDHLSKIDLAEH